MIQFYCGSKGCVGGPDNYSQSYEKISRKDGSFYGHLDKTLIHAQKRFHKQSTRSRRYCYCFLGPSSSKGGYLYPIGFTCIVHRIVIHPVDSAFTESRRLKEASIVFYYCSQRRVYRWF